MSSFTNIKTRNKLMSLILLTVLCGCKSTGEKPIPDDPFYAPVYPESTPTKIAATGSMFQASQASSLYSDIKALKVGDIITIILMEETQAKKSANNEIKKGTNLSVEPVYAGGQYVTINGQTIDLRYSDAFDTKRESDAGQSNSLSGSISANVMQVLNNGNLVVRGEKWISLNNGDEFVRITGIVRSQDIRPDNTIDSPRVANARIQYSGTGTFADVQEVGWLSSFFIGEWWPF